MTIASAEGVSRRIVLAGAGLLLTGIEPVRAAGVRRQRNRVRTLVGDFVGVCDQGVTAFRGIRYGRAPRFRAPGAVGAPGKRIMADAFGPVSPQGDETYHPQSEDCLFLNIWTTEPHPAARKPVMLYLHGGAYSNGSVTDPLNDGQRLAARGDVVVVTVNHRLNAFGYLYLARLDPRFADSGNCGQLDLILALQWVRQNIAAFGGDPERVMLFGQSGGGGKIATLMGMQAADGLFSRAATMSGQQVTASGPINATARTRAFLTALRLRETDLDLLLAMPFEKLLEGLAATDPILGGGVYFGPVLDMKSIVRHPFWPDANPQSLRIPMILGNTLDETRAFTRPDSPKVQGLTWDNVAERMAPDLRTDILPEWVVGQYRQQFPNWSPIDVFYAATTAGRSWRGQVIEAEARARAGAPAWVYQVDFTSRLDPRHGAFHTMDIPLVFGTLDAKGSETGIGVDARTASQTMQNSFVAFAATGDPNHPGLARWPTYDLERRPTMLFDVVSGVEENPRRWQRELFARVPYIQPGT
ncbi:carboxylesterase/lipase family protein [Sphingomonas sp. BIUV-7]|uniref:Carboxylic ester hydrolase n=1 Tax=Sphingomonas natans TaxID=3063330 RepID=A0ABT8Y7I5_9SPHN|nr:carboxylesterase/lipase family protein [Sphingomonas sp. BIUV-7]MDO6414261.1 carboxylesterase/lipase family protein [Sphingomonas sp. BIUV-7]